VRGSAHISNGLPCQDFCAFRVLGSAGELAICAISDGAGSAKFADRGARFCAESAIEYFVQQLIDHPDPKQLIGEYDRFDAEGLVAYQQERIRSIAEKEQAVPEEFASTLMLAIVHPERSLFLQVGDGCWTISRFGIVSAVTWPERGEFVGQTDFIASRSAAQVLQIGGVAGKLDYIVGVSDGLERLAFDMAGCTPHRGFFGPLVQKLRCTNDVPSFEHDLVEFLESERVCERTDDDKTLMMVVSDEPGV